MIPKSVRLFLAGSLVLPLWNFAVGAPPQEKKAGEAQAAKADPQQPAPKEKLKAVAPVQVGHASGSALAFSPDGKVMAYGGSDKIIRIWDTATGKELRQSEGHDSWVMSLAFSADGKTLVSGGADQTIRLWDAATGKELRQFSGDQGWVSSVALSPDGKFLASGSHDHTVCLWNVAAKKEVRPFAAHAAPVSSLAFSPDGKLLASGCEGRLIVLWDTATGRERCRFEGHGGPVLSLAFTPDGKNLVSGGSDRTIRVWELATAKERQRFPVTGEAAFLAVSADGKTLTARMGDSSGLVWDLAGAPRKGGNEPEANLTPQEMDDLWAGLASEDAPKGGQAVRNLTAAPKQAVAFLQQRLRPAEAVDPQKVAALIADLDSDDFATRNKAAKNLEDLGESAEPALRKVLEGQPSLEVRRRVEQLLEKQERQTLPPETLRILRALEVLGNIDTPESRQLLEKMAQGTSGSKATEEAKAALKRMGK